ncbi:hypothetical protein H6B14_16040, partial [Phocaeicola coprophilus]|nr:hypothetical protein [Phocaeicola coprophilus]
GDNNGLSGTFSLYGDFGNIGEPVVGGDGIDITGNYMEGTPSYLVRLGSCDGGATPKPYPYGWHVHFFANVLGGSPPNGYLSC